MRYRKLTVTEITADSARLNIILYQLEPFGQNRPDNLLTLGCGVGGDL